jgi:diguanylate cyclase (GGDEF)-like protein/PAS domain S-box-containing protein
MGDHKSPSRAGGGPLDLEPAVRPGRAAGGNGSKRRGVHETGSGNGRHRAGGTAPAVEAHTGVRSKPGAVDSSVTLEDMMPAARAAEQVPPVDTIGSVDVVAQLAELMQSSDDAIVSTRLTGVIVGWNPAAERLYGYGAEEVVGRHVSLIWPADRRAEGEWVIATLRRGERIDHLETKRARKDGTMVDLSISWSPVRDGHGVIVGCLAVQRDVQERVRATELQAQLAAIVESADDAILSTTLEGVVTSWNAAAEHLFASPREEIMGRDLRSVVPDHRVGEIDAMMDLIASGESIERLEGTWELPDGTTVDISLRASAILDSSGAVVGASAIVHDISERKRHEEALRESQALLEQAQSVGRVGSWRWEGPTNGVLTGTEETYRILGVEPTQDVRGMDFIARVHPEDRSRLVAAVNGALDSHSTFEFEHRVVRSDGSVAWLREVGQAVCDQPGGPAHLIGVVQDISDRRIADGLLRASEERFRTLAENAQDVIYRYGLVPKLQLEFANEALETVTGYTPEEMYDDPRLLEEMVGPERVRTWNEQLGSRRVADPLPETPDMPDIQIRRKDGALVWLNQRWSPVFGPDGRVVAIDGIARDVTDRKTTEQRLEHEATHDPLTSLPNRALVIDHIDEALWHSRAEGGLIAVLFVDLDRFKLLNDTRGHQLGDSVLIAVAERLTGQLAAGDTMGRITGDEFVVVHAGLHNAADAMRAAERTLGAFEEPFTVDSEDVYMSASVGIAISREGDSPEALIRDADLAMYRAKQRGRARVELFDETLRAQAERRLASETGLRRALDLDELTLEFQPVASLDGAHWVGAEALLRWNSAGRGLIGPVEFIPIAEETGLIIPIGEWVMEKACHQLRDWQGQDDPPWSMSINLSAIQLRAPGFAASVERAIAAAGVDPDQLQFEITESVLMADVDFFMKALRSLKDLGVGLSIDDFGTGYSSLAYLRHFPIDEIKIDRSFVDGLGRDDFDATLVSAVVSIANAIGVRVVAEGVETREQLDILRDLGCSHVQGYLLARPAAPDKCLAILRSPLLA